MRSPCVPPSARRRSLRRAPAASTARGSRRRDEGEPARTSAATATSTAVPARVPPRAERSARRSRGARRRPGSPPTPPAIASVQIPEPARAALPRPRRRARRHGARRTVAEDARRRARRATAPRPGDRRRSSTRLPRRIQCSDRRLRRPRSNGVRPRRRTPPQSGGRQVTHDTRPLLVFFTTERSGPARRMESLLAHLARKERRGCASPASTSRSSPTSPSGSACARCRRSCSSRASSVVARLDGRMSAPRIEAMLEPHLGSVAPPLSNPSHRLRLKPIASGAPCARVPRVSRGGRRERMRRNGCLRGASCRVASTLVVAASLTADGGSRNSAHTVAERLPGGAADISTTGGGSSERRSPTTARRSTGALVQRARGNACSSRTSTSASPRSSGGISVFLCTNLGNGPAGTSRALRQPATISGDGRPRPTSSARRSGHRGRCSSTSSSRRCDAGMPTRTSTRRKWPGGEIRGQLDAADDGDRSRLRGDARPSRRLSACSSRRITASPNSAARSPSSDAVVERDRDVAPSGARRSRRRGRPGARRCGATPRIATSGWLTSGVTKRPANLPALVTVKVDPRSSSGFSVPARAASARR